MGLFSLFSSVPKVDADTAREMVADGAVLLDVREKSEWNAGHAPQATHVPLSRVTDSTSRLKAGKPIIVMCASGNRSRIATKSLLDQGFDAVNLAGGMHAWRRAGGQVVGRSGRPA